MSGTRDPRKLSKSYIEQREARRAGREKKPQSEFEKQLQSNIERHVRSLNDQEQEGKTSKAKQRRRWWQFWRRSSPSSELFS